MPQAAVHQYEEGEHLLEADVNQKPISGEGESVVDDSVDSHAFEEKPEKNYYRYTIDTKDPDPWLVKHKTMLIFLVALVATAITIALFYKNYQLGEETKAIVATPQLNDLYYVDFRVIKENLRPSEKFRMAKVEDITGDVVTINFSSYFYLKEHELSEAIRYGQLRFKKFFQEKRHNYKISELESMIESGAIVLARRPEGNMLDGNVVVPDSYFESSSVFIPGKKENLTGLEYLKFAKGANHAELAFSKFEESADLGFAKGQVNLAQMYLNGMTVEKDMHEALALFKEASLQAYKPAILKYAIVCQQVQSCTVTDFYEELVQAGINIEFTKQANVRATTKAFERALENAKK